MPAEVAIGLVNEGQFAIGLEPANKIRLVFNNGSKPPFAGQGRPFRLPSLSMKSVMTLACAASE